MSLLWGVMGVLCIEQEEDIMAEQESLLERLARKNSVTVDEMRKQLENRIKQGLTDPDPERRSQWERIPCSGTIPTPEEYLDYVVKKLHDEGCEDLLRKYPNL